MIRIYGHPYTRSTRATWALEEAGVVFVKAHEARRHPVVQRNVQCSVDAVVARVRALGLRAADSRPPARPVKVRLLRDQADRAAHRSCAVESSLRSAQHLDALHVAREHLSEIETTIGDAGIAHINAVDDKFGMI